MKLLQVLVLLCFTGVAGAGDQSVMVKDKASESHKYDQVFNAPRPDGKTEGDKCSEMAKEVEALKGKPQRRYALMQLYKQECELK